MWVPTSAESTLSEDIVILYTNDVHTYIDGSLSYDVIAAVKQDLQTQYKHVLLVDAGDHAQGTAYGSMDKGMSIIDLMNTAGYDAATLGNHEMDYGMDGCFALMDRAAYPYVSCNFYHEQNGVRGENLLPSYQLFSCGEQTIAIVGITTPETLTKTTPSYFQDENGRYIYGIAGGADGAALYADVQRAVNEAKADGATVVIALGHLGVDPSSRPWTSEETIVNVTGIDAFIDGHSHTIIEEKRLHDAAEDEVVLTQTGEYFDRIGMMVIDAQSGQVQTDFIEWEETENGVELRSDLYEGTVRLSDPATSAVLSGWMSQVDEQLGQVIGRAEVTLDNYDENGNRLVRTQQTNSGDFAADALYYVFDSMDLDVDVAVMNGGGIRNTAITGDMTYKTCKDMLPFGNVACLQTVTGQQLLDMLEWSTRDVGRAENGSLLHVSGITYTVNTAIPNTMEADEMDVWQRGPSGAYRVRDVKVYNKDTDTWDPLVLDARYNLAGYNYTLRDMGGGFAMLNDSVNVLDYVMEDYMTLAAYVQGFEDHVVRASNSPLTEKYPSFFVDYRTVYGSGRMTIVEEQTTTTTVTTPTDPSKSPLTGHFEETTLWIPLTLLLSLAAVSAAKAFKRS
ncbi:MAG: bifunctional metallophosphatase/5'-nucleotidase [Clostridia bacterium]|nr:bifunctional metallophosphatase/5'-nucleotidase [Clostridia bacterium]